MKNVVQMNFGLLVAVLFSLVFFNSCTEENKFPYGVESPPVLSFDGFVYVNANGQKTSLGINGEGGRASEYPRMDASFTYNFYISEHEVSRAEYSALRKNAGAECSGVCNDNSPVTNVTYYDAVLYANAKSKAENLDTVYTYTKASFDAKGSCIDLDGLVFHEKVNGFRLPTEAEWVYVASQGWYPEKGWNSQNSGFVVHDVATSPANDLGVYDMAGNVLEWVNDWLTFFSSSPVTNFVGGADGGSLGERVVKGGSFRDDPSQINTYGRGDIYTVSSSTKGHYLGFRLAIGPIPNAIWLDENGTAKESVVIPLLGIYETKHMTGSFQSKLVFRNDLTGNLAYIDYGNGINSVVEIKDTIQAYHPDVSPNGKLVAFCTGVEGVPGTSSIYVRNLDASGSGLVKLNVKSAAIPRWRVTDEGDTSIVYVSSAANNKEDADFAAMSTWQVPFAKGKFGTPQKLFDGAFHGGVSSDKKLAVTGSTLLRVRMSSGKDSVWYNGEQACNVSLANDGSNRTVFLDFGGKTGANYVGQSYNTHERLLVANEKGELVHSVAAPHGYTFDHTEWALGGSNLVVATLTNLNGAHQKIVLVDLSTDSIKTLVEGDELWHPCLWHSKNRYDGKTLDTDSAGVYYLTSASSGALDLRVKMERFWENRNEITAVALGSSRMMFALRDKEVKSHNMLNMAFSAGQMAGASYLFKNYILKHLKKLKVLVLELSPDLFWADAYATWIDVIYNKVPGYMYDENHDFWVDSLPEHFLDVVKETPRPESALQLLYTLEDFSLPTGNWAAAVCIRDSNVLTYDSPVFAENEHLFEEIVVEARNAGLKVVLAVLPQNPGYAKTGTFGIYGPRRSIAMELIEASKKFDAIVFDENKFGNHDYTDDMAYNADHLSGVGAKLFTHRLDSLLMTLE
ncbi:MAG: TIGR02171 family protein [Fibrobacter sp.]|nr:TIGR02171 family protein [Fibrobacter sp.]